MQNICTLKGRFATYETLVPSGEKEAKCELGHNIKLRVSIDGNDIRNYFESHQKCDQFQE